MQHSAIIRFFICFCVLFTGITVPLDAQTIVKQNGKYGLADESGEIIIKPQYDSIYCLGVSSENSRNRWDNFYILKAGHRYGYAIRLQWQIRKIRQPESYSWTDISDEIDSTKWRMSDVMYDSLFRMGVFKDLTVDTYAKTSYCGRDIEETEREFFTLGYEKNGKAGLIVVDFAKRVEEKKYADGFGRYSVFFSMEKVTEHPPHYDKVFLKVADGYYYNFYIVTVAQGKYGIEDICIGKTYSNISDTVPLNVKDRIEVFYVKKSGRWGLVYLRQDSAFAVNLIPYTYGSLAELSGIRSGTRAAVFDNNIAFYSAMCYSSEFSDTLIIHIFHSSYVEPRLSDLRTYSIPVNTDSLPSGIDFYFSCDVILTKSSDGAGHGSLLTINIRDRDPDLAYRSYGVLHYRIGGKGVYLQHAYYSNSVNCKWIPFYYQYGVYHDSLLKAQVVIRETKLPDNKYSFEFYDLFGALQFRSVADYPYTHYDIAEDKLGHDSRVDYFVVNEKEKNIRICSYDLKKGKYSK